MRALAALLGLCLLFHTNAVWAQQPSIAVTPVQGQQAESCQNALYQNFIRHSELQVLPDWYVQSQLQGSWQNNWPLLFQQLPEADQAVLVKVQQDSLLALLVQRNGQILRSEILEIKRYRPEIDCAVLGRQVLGLQEPQTFRNPALSASLSLIIPGAGHFYQASWEGILLGTLFLSAYIVMGFLGLSNATDPQISRSQWGGMMLILSLLDTTTAYFMAEQNP